MDLLEIIPGREYGVECRRVAAHGVARRRVENLRQQGSRSSEVAPPRLDWRALLLACRTNARIGARTNERRTPVGGGGTTAQHYVLEEVRHGGEALAL